MHLLFGLSLVLLLSPLVAQAASPDLSVLVEAPPLLDETIEASRSVKVLSAKDIRAKNRATVADVLRDVPGVEVVRQGPTGQTTSIFIRGARSEDTLVLIDGAEANDALSPASGYDFSSLSVQNIERIEVYRGPQSVRFGGGALGGVINIVTKEGQGPAHGSYFVEGGSFDTVSEGLGILGRSRTFSYAASVDFLKARGFSAADVRDGNTERDGAQIGTASTKLTWKENASTRVDATFHYSKSDVAIDQRGGPGGDDPNDMSRSSQVLAGVEAQSRFFDQQLKSTLGVYYAEAKRDDENPPDPLNPDASSDYFLSENQKLESTQEYALGEHNRLRLNLQLKNETGVSSSVFNGAATLEPRQHQTSTGEALTYLYESATWFADAGARADEVSLRGTIPSERASLGRLFSETQTRVSFTYGTGFKVPSLYQLYSIYGDKNLRQESSDTTELTVEKKFSTRLTGSLAYFHNQYRDMIDFDTATGKYLNISSARSQGIEAQATAALASTVAIKTNYTYLDAVDGTTGLALLRRPKHVGSARLTYDPAIFQIFAEVLYDGTRPDENPVTYARTTDAAAAIISVGGSICFNSHFKLSARIENLLDRTYEEVSGYGTAGRSFYLGLGGDI